MGAETIVESVGGFERLLAIVRDCAASIWYVRRPSKESNFANAAPSNALILRQQLLLLLY